MTDKTISFQEFFNEQQVLMERMGWPGGTGQEGLRNHFLAAQVEIVEALMETNWKPWKPDYLFPIDNDARACLGTEITDAMQFLVNAALCMGFTAEDLSDGLRAKLIVNHQRTDDGETTSE